MQKNTLAEHYLEVLDQYFSGDDDVKDLRPALMMFFDHLDNKMWMKDYIDEIPLTQFEDLLKIVQQKRNSDPLNIEFHAE